MTPMQQPACSRAAPAPSATRPAAPACAPAALRRRRQQQQRQQRRLAGTLLQQQQLGAAAAPRSASAPQDVRLYYRSSWRRAIVHGSVAGAPWQDVAELLPLPSAPHKWLAGTVSVGGVRGGGGDGAPPPLEFVVSDGAGAWDKPAGGNYVAAAPGAYVLRGGVLAARPANGPPPVMVVSDLDGTMVGDDRATAEFKSWWEDEAALRGSLLVYNTGRALPSFERLLGEKAACLATPQVLISAVGTKIYNYAGSSGSGSGSGSSGSGRWVEDAGWAARLDEGGWRVAAVREAAYAALAEVGKDLMHFRPPEEQNDHKVTCGVAAAALDRVAARVAAAAAANGVGAGALSVVVSGAGDWRFVDLIPSRAGKLAALEYVREQHNFPLAATVACGDSGNDASMLGDGARNLAVVVGNAQPDLLAWLERQQQQGAGAEAPAPLQGKQRLLRAQRHEAYGILEALGYWGYL